jgi:protein gp37
MANRFVAFDKPHFTLGMTGAFSPTFWPDRLDQPAKVKKPSKIFVCSMADLFGDWVLEEWIIKVRAIAYNNPQHIFQFLTKNPKRLKYFKWPDNCWVGTTVTNQADADEWLPWLLQVEAPVRFVSHEPLLGEIDMQRYLVGVMAMKVFRDHGGKDATIIPEHLKPRPYLHWAIIGAMTGPGAVKPKPEWVQGLLDQYRDAGVPVFVKGSLYKDFPIREWPG